MAELRQALIIGATGAVGQQLCARLSQQPEYSAIHVMVRRSVKITLPKVQVHIVDFDNLPADHPAYHVDDVFIAIGTTMSTVKSKDLFRIVDLFYPKVVSRHAVEHGASRILAVSSMGASAHKRNFYLRVKGEMEEAIRQTGAALTVFFRPSFVVGKRKEFRPLEWLGILASTIILAPFCNLRARYGSISATEIADSMVAIALQHDSGDMIIQNANMRVISKGFNRD
ncbi:MAG: NAD(P)H-binding protein [bacterium]|nr:NAD(P)H-binding protein [bacterium]